METLSGEFLGPTNAAIFFAFLALLPFFAVCATSFTKIIVVLHILRSALGLQQAPSNMVLNGVSIILTAYIMAPVISETAQQIGDFGQIDSAAHAIQAYDTSIGPFRDFMKRFSGTAETAFFVNIAQQIWPDQYHDMANDSSLAILLPAFLTSELSRAFQIGLMIYLPFIVVDMVVANILMALGMIMVSPMMISLPFKLALFVAVDGWVKLLHGLVLSYSQ